MEVAAAAPFVEKLVAEGYEVLYLTEAVDEAVVTNLAKFNDVDLVDVSKEGLDLPGGEEEGKKVRRTGGALLQARLFSSCAQPPRASQPLCLCSPARAEGRGLLNFQTFSNPAARRPRALFCRRRPLRASSGT